MEIEIVKLATFGNRISQEEALKLAKEKGLRLLTNLEHDALLSGDEWKSYKDCYPAWTGTKIEYAEGAIVAKVGNVGEEMVEIPFPEGNEWRSVEPKYGIPNGDIISSRKKEARYLWRYSTLAFSGLVSRVYFGWNGGGDRRFVGCGVDDWRLGVLATPLKPEEKR